MYPAYLDELAHALLNYSGCLGIIAGQLLECLGPVLRALKVCLMGLCVCMYISSIRKQHEWQARFDHS